MQNIFPEKCNVGTFDHFSGIKELFSMFFDKECQRLLHSSIHSAEAASLGIRQSPRGDNDNPTFGPSGRHERLNCWLKNLRQNVVSQCFMVALS